MRPFNSLNKRQGFTLLELLVVMAVLAILTTLGVQAFITLTTSWNHTRALTELTHKADNALDLFGRDVQDILSAKLSGQSIIGEQRVSENDSRFEKIYDEDDRVVLPLQGIHLGLSLQNSTSVQYAVQRGSGSPFLVRSVGAFGNPQPEQNPFQPIDGAHTTRFRVEYNDGKHWVGNWDTAELPRAIRVSLTVADSDNPAIQIARKRVYPVKVQ